ncbi:class I SAM-dependent methyltransferase [Amycolatopsis sp. CA-230715]|uniref:class I SAM-dependent methyltransferase n=1 Tax=Amycolatopsis sp. CA-230715 TaxID=2745196 RepID=UPI001C02F41F|nr:class I SAM-dependent methyltransferase [Amycolatopsis sp. CA-230715]QWF85277.1 Trans-aconitate 2-methyltransferase [Amycolatopsis sp. CA-230715]
MDQDLAARWVARWDTQQERYIADREERFRVLIDVVEHVTGDAAEPFVLDLGCGPGSTATRLSARLPHARIVGVDSDPFLLALARASRPEAAKIDYRLLDLAEDRWHDPAVRGRELDAAVSTTALHWLPPERLAVVYRDLAEVMRPGGVLVNGDHFYDEQPGIRALTAAVKERRATRAGVDGNEDWKSWWAAAAEDPALRAIFSDAELRGTSTGYGNRLSQQAHAKMLLDAGFREVGMVWQYGDDYVLAALR